MIGLERKKSSNNQFNNALLIAQDKVFCNKITEIREEKNKNSIYTGSTTSRAYVQSSSNPLEIFHYLCKSFTYFEHTLGFLTLVLNILTIQETTSLLTATDFMRWIERFASFRVEDTNWRP